MILHSTISKKEKDSNKEKNEKCDRVLQQFKTYNKIPFIYNSIIINFEYLKLNFKLTLCCTIFFSVLNNLHVLLQLEIGSSSIRTHEFQTNSINKSRFMSFEYYWKVKMFHFMYSAMYSFYTS